jgi:hypothetical protein
LRVREGTKKVDVKHPGFDAHVTYVCDRLVLLVLSVVLGFGFRAWSAAEAVHEPGGVVPVHPSSGGELDVADVA